jgi:polygalacturonase
MSRRIYMSSGGAQFKDYVIPAYPAFKLRAFDAGTSNAATIWSDEAKTTAITQPLVADANGVAVFYGDNDYKFTIHDTNDVLRYTWDNVRLTADPGTMWQGNFGTALPSAVANAKGQMFATINAGNILRAVSVNQNTSWQDIYSANASGNQEFTSIVAKSYPWYDVTHSDWGALGDGVTDDTTAIQNAINAAEAAGYGIIFFPAGTYVVTSLTVESSGIMLMGAGVDVTVLETSSATADIITLGDGSTTYNNITVKDMTIDTSVTRTAGAAIELNKINRVILDNIKTDSQIFSINAPSGVTNTSVFISRFELREQVATTGVGISLDGDIHDVYINELIMNTTGSEPGIGIRMTAANRVWITNSHLINAGKGIYIFPGAGDTVDRIFIENTEVASGDDNGFLIDSNTATSTVTNVVLDGLLVKENALNGIQVTGHASAVLDGIYIDDCQVFGNTQDGISVGEGINVEISSCNIAGNSKGSSGTYHGIDISAGVSQWSVKNCKSGQQAGEANEQGYGLNIGVGAGNDFEVIGNNFKNNATGGINDGSTGTDKLFANNETDLSNTIASAASVTLPPDAESFLLSGSTAIDNIVGSVWDRRIVHFVLTGAVDFNDKSGGTGELNLNGSANWTTGAADDTISFIYSAGGTAWFELGTRGDNT